MRLKTKYKSYRNGGRVLAAEAEADVPSAAPEEATGGSPLPAAPSIPPSDGLDEMPLPPLAKSWLRKNPEYLQDEHKNERLQSLHHDLVREGFEGYSADYFAEIDRRLAPKPEPMIERSRSRSGMYSAPPSREVPTASGVRHSYDGKITLTGAQKEAARMSGISEGEYAQQLMRLLQEKANGSYGGQP